MKWMAYEVRGSIEELIRKTRRIYKAWIDL